MAHKSLRPRKKRHGAGHEEEHENHERWLVTYADMLTLLMVLFIVMFAMSAVDKRKFAALADGLANGFGAPSVAFSGKSGAMDGEGQDKSVIPLQAGADPGLQAAIQQSGEADDKELQEAVEAAERSKASADAQAAIKEVENLREVQKHLTEALTKAKLLESVRFAIDERGLVVTIVSSEVVFAGDRAELRPGGRKILSAIAPTLAKLPNNIEVDGHTNQLPVATRFYPSGWELSTARAATTVRYLANHGIKGTRLSAAGFADYRPLIPPSDPRSVRMNRRVDIIVLSTLPAEQRSLLPTAANGPEHKDQ